MKMVDVGDKQKTQRVAVATGRVRMSAAALAKIRTGRVEKGDVIGAARIFARAAALMRTRPVATATRWVFCLPPTSTIFMGTEGNRSPLVEDELPGVLRDAVDAHLVVEMRARRAPGVAQGRNDVAALHVLT